MQENVTSAVGPGAPIKAVGLQQRVLEAIRQGIITGDYPPGAALSEVALAQTYGISRTPVREALKQLQAEGLVQIKQRVGTFVAQPSHRQLVELFDLKEVLEGLGARLLARRGPCAELTTLDKNLQESEVAIRDGDLKAYATLVDEFHSTIVAGADQGKLAEHYRQLMNQLAYHRLVVTTLSRPHRPRASCSEHAEIVEHIRAKDAYGAEAAMRRHVRTSHEELMVGLVEADQGTSERRA
jgi:DNA-binding GntR family transcriptional regulator